MASPTTRLLMQRWASRARLALLCGLLMPLCGLEWEHQGVRYCGRPEDIAALQEATTALDALVELGETATGAQVHRVRMATQDLRPLRMRLQVTPVRASSVSAAPQRAHSAHVHTVLREYLWDIAAELYDRPDAYRQWLESLLPHWTDHPARARIIWHLAEASVADPERALHWYAHTLFAPDDARDGNWEASFNLTGHMARQRMAEIHEQRGDYATALELLNNWEVREPCGTGIMSTEFKRQFWIWRLQLRQGTDDHVMAHEIWDAMADDASAFASSVRSTVGALLTLPWSPDYDLHSAAAARRSALDTPYPTGAPESQRRLRSILNGIQQVAAAEAFLPELSLPDLIAALCPPVHHPTPGSMPEPVDALYHSHMRGDTVLLARQTYARQRFVIERETTLLRRAAVLAEIARREQPQRVGQLKEAWIYRRDSKALLALMIDPATAASTSTLEYLSDQTGSEATVALLMVGTPAQRLRVAQSWAERQRSPSAETRIRTLLRQTSPVNAVSLQCSSWPEHDTERPTGHGP